MPPKYQVSIIAVILLFSFFSFLPSLNEADALEEASFTTEETITLQNLNANYPPFYYVDETYLIILQSNDNATLARHIFNLQTGAKDADSIAITSIATCDSSIGIGSVQTDYTVYVYCNDAGTTNHIIANVELLGATLTINNSTQFAVAAATRVSTSLTEDETNIYAFGVINGADETHYARILTRNTGAVGAEITTGLTAIVQDGNFKSRSFSWGAGETYVVFEHTTVPDWGIAKFSGTAWSLVTSTLVGDENIRSYSFFQTDTELIIDTGTRVYSMARDDNAITELYTQTFTSREMQTRIVSENGIEFVDNDNGAYLADDTFVDGWNPSTGKNTGGTIAIVENVNNISSTINLESTKYWLVNSTTIMTGSGTTHTVLSSDDSIKFDVFSEKLLVPLFANQSAGSFENIFLACDAFYTMPAPHLLGIEDDDQDCGNVIIKDVVESDVGRTLPFINGRDLVYAEEFTNYNIHVKLATGDSEDFYVKVLYQGLQVDQSNFDAGDNAQVRLLYGQCYTVQYVESTSGDVRSTSNLCADDVIFKEDVILSELGFTFWSARWGGSHIWDTDTKILTTIVHHNDVPYNYTVVVLNNTGNAIVNQTFTGVVDTLDTQQFNLTAFTGEGPFRVKYFTEEGQKFYDQYFEIEGNWFAPFEGLVNDSLGTFSGWGILLFLPIIFAAIFTRNTAGIGGGMIVAFIGLIVVFGILTVPAGVLVLITFVAIVGILAYRVLQ